MLCLIMCSQGPQIQLAFPGIAVSRLYGVSKHDMPIFWGLHVFLGGKVTPSELEVSAIVQLQYNEGVPVAGGS